MKIVIIVFLSTFLLLSCGTAKFNIVKTGSLKEIKAAVKNGAYINEVGVDQQTPILVALKYRDGKELINIVNFFLKKGADLNLVDYNGENVFHYLMRHQADDEIVLKLTKLFIENGADINFVNYTAKQTPIFTAIKSNKSLKVIEYLVDKADNINQVDRYNRNILYYAVEHQESYPLVRYLVSKNVEYKHYNRYYGLPFYDIIDKNLAKYLISLGINKKYFKNVDYDDGDIENKDNKLEKFDILTVIKEDNVEALKQIIEKKGKDYINSEIILTYRYPITPFIASILLKSDNISKYLIELGVDIDKKFKIYIKDKYVDDKIYKQIRKNEEIYSKYSYYKYYDNISPIHLAVFLKRYDVVKMILEKKNIVNIRTNKGLTPAIIASWQGDIEMLKILNSFKADLNFTNFQKFTTLHFALWNSKEDCAIFLIENGVDINSKNFLSITPLHIAVQKDLYKVTNYLLINGAKIIKDYDGKIAKYYAVGNVKKLFK